MARQLRVQFKNAIYHIIARGNEGRNIFFEKCDFKIFLKHLLVKSRRFNVVIYCYCLMNNHFHLMLKTKEANLSDFMKRLLGDYACNINRKYKRVGHLFQGRYKAILIGEEKYLLQLSRYIHLNPCKANIIQVPEKYEWSSMKAYLKNGKYSFLSSYEILRCFEYNPMLYKKFVYEGINEQVNLMDEVIGGLVLGSRNYLDKVKEIIKNQNKNNVSNLKEIYKLPTSVIMQTTKMEDECIKIFCLWEYAKLSQREIGNKFHKSQAAVSMIIKRIKEQVSMKSELTKKIQQIETSFKGVS